MKWLAKVPKVGKVSDILKVVDSLAKNNFSTISTGAHLQHAGLEFAMRHNAIISYTMEASIKRLCGLTLLDRLCDILRVSLKVATTRITDPADRHEKQETYARSITFISNSSFVHISQCWIQILVSLPIHTQFESNRIS